MLKQDFILDRIRSGFRLWSLYLIKSFSNRVHVATYKGDDVSTDDDDDAKTQKSLNRLQSLLASMPNGQPLSIDLRNSTTANGTGVVGPLEFTNSLAVQQPEQFAGLGGAVPAGYVSRSELEGLLLQNKMENEEKFAAYKREQEKKQFDEWRAAQRAEIEKQRKEVEDLKKHYDSGVAKTADVLVLAGERIISALVPSVLGPAATAPASPAQLGATQPDAAQNEQISSDPKAQALEELAEMLYNNCTENEIRELKKRLKNGTPKQAAAQNTDLDDDTEFEEF